MRRHALAPRGLVRILGFGIVHPMPAELGLQEALRLSGLTWEEERFLIQYR